MPDAPNLDIAVTRLTMHSDGTLQAAGMKLASAVTGVDWWEAAAGDGVQEADDYGMRCAKEQAFAVVTRAKRRTRTARQSRSAGGRFLSLLRPD